MTAPTTPDQIKMFRIRTLIQAVKLESLGMRRRGRSAATIAKEELGLPRSTSNEEVIKALLEQMK